MNYILKTMMLFGLVGLTSTVNGNGLPKATCIYIETTLIGILIRNPMTINVLLLSTTNGEVDLVVLSTNIYVKHGVIE